MTQEVEIFKDGLVADYEQFITDKFDPRAEELNKDYFADQQNMASNKSYITEAEIYNYLGGNYTMLLNAKAEAAAALATTKLDKGIMDSVHIVTYTDKKAEVEIELTDLYERYKENC